MKTVVSQALKRWNLEGASYTFVTGRENQVYRVSSPEGEYALRIKRPGLRTEQELLSELVWLEAMSRSGLSVPTPKPSGSGKLLEKIDSYTVDLLGWMQGDPLGQTGLPLDLTDPEAVFYRTGVCMAKFHLACDNWPPPTGFQRISWDSEGLLGEAPLWGRFWDNPSLDDDSKQLFEQFRAQARDRLNRYAGQLDYGLIHADMVRENILIDGDRIHILDFDDSGFGYRLFDVATALIKNLDEPNFIDLQAALINGYSSQRPLDIKHLNLFMALRATTYVGWIISRMKEKDAQVRNKRFISTARKLCTDYLASLAKA